MLFVSALVFVVHGQTHVRCVTSLPLHMTAVLASVLGHRAGTMGLAMERLTGIQVLGHSSEMAVPLVCWTDYHYPCVPSNQSSCANAELRASVAVCLTELDLTDFLAAIEGSDINSLLASPDAEVTVFAPTNFAINGQFLSQANLRAHFLDEVVRNSDLRSYSVLHPITEETLLHVTDVHTYTRHLEFTEVSYYSYIGVTNSVWIIILCRRHSSMELK